MFIAFVIFISPLSVWSSPTEQESVTPIQGDLKIPENYQQKKQQVEKQNQVIPLEASKTTSPGAFGGKILEYHLADVIENNQFKPLKSVQSLEKAVNSNTQVESNSFKMKSKIDVNRLKAEVDIETFVNTKVWTENSFKTLRAQMDLYQIENAMISLQNKTDKEDTRTYLNIEKTW